jgi:3-hydroxy-9,10-secoandrosta-1,3,5(10)-triene-9,17-dione monooxygenase
MAQGALDSYVQEMASKKRATMRPGTPASAADSPFAQERAGKAWSQIAAAKALLLSELNRIEPKAIHGQTPDVQERVAVRQAIAFAARQALDSVSLLSEGAGAPASSVDNAIQRHWRDVCSGARHVSLDIRAINTMAGQHLFGITPAGAF